MSKRITFTTITPLPASAARETAVAYLHNHLAMIDLNPLVQSRHHLMCPPPHAKPSELRCTWYAITDRLVPGVRSPVTYTAAFTNLPSGLQTHTYAPMGCDIRGKWTIGGSLPGETREPVEPGLKVPSSGLYLREDVDLRCNLLMAGFVKKTLKKAHAGLAERLVAESMAENETDRPRSPTTPFRYFANDETFVNSPAREPSSFLKFAAERESGIDDRTRPDSDFFFAATKPQLLTSNSPSLPTSDPPSPPTFLRAPTGSPALRLSCPPPFPRMPRPKATQPAPALSPYPAPLRVPNRHSSALPTLSPAPNSPDSLGFWARDSLPVRPQSAMLNRNISVVSKYPRAAEQDYSDIAAMNPFDSDDEDSDSTADTFPSEADTSGELTESPVTIVAGSPGAPSQKKSGLPPQINLRFEFDDSGPGLGIGVPGELLEENYAVLEGKLPVLKDNRLSTRRLPRIQTTFDEPRMTNPTFLRV